MSQTFHCRQGPMWKLIYNLKNPLKNMFTRNDHIYILEKDFLASFCFTENKHFAFLQCLNMIKML